MDKEPFAEMTQDEVQEGIHGVMRHPRANGDGNGMWMCKRPVFDPCGRLGPCASSRLIMMVVRNLLMATWSSRLPLAELC